MNIINTTAEKYLNEPWKAKLIFADPPDNVGLDYANDPWDDLRQDYYKWMEEVIRKSIEKCEVFWISYNAIHEYFFHDQMKTLAKTYRIRKVLWRYTFSQYKDTDFAIGYRPMFIISKPGCIFYPEQILIRSGRTEIGDPRAMGPRLPDNVWDFPRVVGNSWERRAWHPTQHPQDLLSRIIRYCCYVPAWQPIIQKQKEQFKLTKVVDSEVSMKNFSSGDCEVSPDLVVDLFMGSGSCARVCKKLNVPYIGIEQSERYCEHVRKELIC